MKKIKALRTKYKPSLTDSEYKYLSHNYFETSNFYGRPKIHKSEILHKAIKEQNKELITILEPKDFKLRPIVGGPKCPTRRLSNFLDLILKPLTKHVKSNIKDNIEFLKICERNVTDGTVLVTFDIRSLYTNIPHEFGLIRKSNRIFCFQLQAKYKSKVYNTIRFGSCKFYFKQQFNDLMKCFICKYKGPQWVQFLPLHTLHYQWASMK